MNIKKTGIIIMTSSLLGGVAITPLINKQSMTVNASEQSNNSSLKENNFVFDNKLSNLDSDEIAFNMIDSLYEQGIDIEAIKDKGHSISKRGIKSQAAKIAAKQLKNAIMRMGKNAFENMLAKIPFARSFLSYEGFMKVLNIATDFEGDITNGLQHGMRNVGIPDWISGVVSRALVTVFL